jgi:hypothetical protein
MPDAAPALTGFTVESTALDDGASREAARRCDSLRGSTTGYGLKW